MSLVLELEVFTKKFGELLTKSLVFDWKCSSAFIATQSKGPSPKSSPSLDRPCKYSSLDRSGPRWRQGRIVSVITVPLNNLGYDFTNFLLDHKATKFGRFDITFFTGQPRPKGSRSELAVNSWGRTPCLRCPSRGVLAMTASIGAWRAQNHLRNSELISKSYFTVVNENELRFPTLGHVLGPSGGEWSVTEVSCRSGVSCTWVSDRVTRWPGDPHLNACLGWRKTLI